MTGHPGEGNLNAFSWQQRRPNVSQPPQCANRKGTVPIGRRATPSLPAPRSAPASIQTREPLLSCKGIALQVLGASHAASGDSHGYRLPVVLDCPQRWPSSQEASPEPEPAKVWGQGDRRNGLLRSGRARHSLQGKPGTIGCGLGLRLADSLQPGSTYVPGRARSLRDLRRTLATGRRLLGLEGGSGAGLHAGHRFGVAFRAPQLACETESVCGLGSARVLALRPDGRVFPTPTAGLCLERKFVCTPAEHHPERLRDNPEQGLGFGIPSCGGWLTHP